jgi:hypothetical protein
MKSITLGIVAEGPSDLLVLEHLLRKVYPNTTESTLALRNLQPYVDNTSRSGFSEGGWQLVYKWCVANPPEIREDSLFGTPLFADDMDAFQCDALLLHMDSDICAEIGDKTSVSPVPGINDEPKVHGEFIEATLAEWLWPDGPKQDNRYILAPAVQSTEAWLVAGLSDSDVNPEADENIQRRLAELDYQVIRKTPLPAKIKGVKKSVKNYERIVAVAKENIDRIKERCPHFFEMLKRVEVVFLGVA